MSNYGSGDFKTRYGTIHVRNPGSFSVPNLQTLRRVKGGDALPGYKYSASAGNVVLQGPALRAFRAAELRATPKRLRKKGLIQPILITGVGYRSYKTQKVLYEGPDNTNGTRYADPDGSMHVEALAIDNNNSLNPFRKLRVKKALLLEGWHYPIEGEPWHASYVVSG